LRQRRHDRWLEALRNQLAEVLVAFPCRVWLFGSRARGDWDGFSDTDLLVVAESAERAERAADRLRSAGVGNDVLSLEEGRWQAMADSPSPHWRAVRAQARCIHPTPSVSPWSTNGRTAVKQLRIACWPGSPADDQAEELGLVDAPQSAYGGLGQRLGYRSPALRNQPSGRR